MYGIDYLTHDIPTYIFSISENYQTCKSFFYSLRLLNYPLQAVVSDDNINIYESCLSVYPRAVTQLCQNHFKESLRLNLGLGTNLTYKPFMRDIEHLFEGKRSFDDFTKLAGKIYQRYSNDQICTSVMTDIQKRLPNLLAYTKLKGIPKTTNLIESYNSHMEGRLKTIKGFDSFSHADHWLNAYFIKRRLKKFTDCTHKFRKLNGKCSLQLSLNEKVRFDEVLRLIR